MAVTFERVRKMALLLENVTEGTSYGTSAFKAGSKLFARLREDRESLVVGTTFEEREDMITAERETNYVTDHYLKYPWVFVRLSRVHPDALQDLIRRAWRLASMTTRRASGRRPSTYREDSSRRRDRE